MRGSIRCLCTCALLALTVPTRCQSPGLYDVDTLRTFYFTFASSTWYNDLRTARSSNTNVKANLVVDSVLYKDVGVRFRGVSSYLGVGTKKSINLTMDAFVPGQELLGYDSLNLSNGFNDPTLCREVLAYGLLRKYMPAPKANYAKVYINGSYFGLYINVQQPDKKFIGRWYNGNDGNRYRCDPPASSGRGNSALQWLGTTLQNYKDAYELKANLANSVKPWEDVRDLCNVLNNTANAQLETALPRVFDVDQALWYLSLNIVLVNLDSYVNRGNDYYLYHDKYHDHISMLPWDMNESFGGYAAGMSITARLNLTPFYNVRSSRPLLGKMFNVVPEWRARYMHHVKTLIDEDFSWAKIGPLVTKYQKLIDAAVQADTNKLYSYTKFKDNVTKQMYVNSSFFRTEIPGVKQLVDGRVAAITKLTEYKAARPAITNVMVTPSQASIGSPVAITAKITNTVAMGATTLYYREVGDWLKLTMFDDGNHGDGAANDGVFGAIVPATMHTAGGKSIRYYVGALSATAQGGAASYSPDTAAFAAPRYRIRYKPGLSPITINEVLAKNASVIKDEKGEFEDYLELYNSSTSAVTVSGMYLTDSFSNPTKWKIPAGYSIPAHGSLLIWCDDEPNDGPLHATFKLDGDGETVSLFDTDGTTKIDELDFGEQADDISNGLSVDGNMTSFLVAFKTPTPAAANAPECAAHGFWPLDHAAHRLVLGWSGTPKIATTNSILVSNGPASSSVALYMAVGPSMIPLGGGLHILLGVGLTGPFGLPTNASGAAAIPVPIPNDSALKGLSVFLQAVGTDTTGFTLSNGVEIRICK
jgi:hypothetical protein